MSSSGYVNSVNLYEQTDFPYLVLDVTDSGSVPVTAGFKVWHWHEDFQLVYVLAGGVSVRTLAWQKVLEAGEGIFISKNVVHLVEITGSGHYNSFIFPESFLGFCQQGAVGRLAAEALTGGMPEVIFLPRGKPWTDEALTALRELSALESSRGENFYFYEVLVKLNSIFLLLLKNHKPVEVQAGALNARMRSFLKYIDEHYCEALTLEKIAAAANVSKSECLRSFRLALKTTPWKHLMEVRMAKAAWLLAYTDEPAGWIAEASGFSRQSYFGKCFREHMGCSPCEYRKRTRAADQFPL